MTESLLHSTMVFTDLDGTLLDHDSYSFEAAVPALAALAQRNIDVVPVTSKTMAELHPLMAALELSGAAIAENGAVIKHANGAIDLAATRPGLDAALAGLPDKLRRTMRCFCDMGATEIATETGLDEAEAALAAQREATEPFLWGGDETELAALADALTASDFRLTQGGRFYHIIPPRDKAAAIEVLLAQKTPRPQTWALGDGPNDTAMLLAADRGALIANPHSDAKNLLPDGHQLYLSAKTGPAGWRDAIAAFLGSDFG